VSRKDPSAISEALREELTEARNGFVDTLKEGLKIIETSLCDRYGHTELILEHHTKVLGRLMKLLNLFGQAKADELGLTIMQPTNDHGDGNAES
jgi:hypothetical protein